jgi:acyl-CoA synthetase (AMP-forming)/AMP-acid ligase II
MKLPAFLAAHAAATPGREALVCEGLRTSFAELDRRSSCLGAALAQLGVGAGDRVAIHLPNCAEFVLAFVAIVKLGAIAVPIGTRLACGGYVLADSAPQAASVGARATFVAAGNAAGRDRGGLRPRNDLQALVASCAGPVRPPVKPMTA